VPRSTCHPGRYICLAKLSCRLALRNIKTLLQDHWSERAVAWPCCCTFSSSSLQKCHPHLFFACLVGSTSLQP
jgi:hypothetical protein